MLFESLLRSCVTLDVQGPWQSQLVIFSKATGDGWLSSLIHPQVGWETQKNGSKRR